MSIEFERDYLQINFALIDIIRRVFRKAPKEQNDLPLIQNLVVEIKTISLGDAHLIAICQFFFRLKQLYIIEPDFSTTTYGIPHTFRAEEKSFRHDWARLARRIRAAIPFVREKLKSWTPPELTIGTRSEWQFRGTNIRARMQFSEKFQRTIRGEMEGVQLTAFFPSLGYLPMYQGLNPELTYSLSIEPAPAPVQKDTNDNVAVANYFRK